MKNKKLLSMFLFCNLFFANNLSAAKNKSLENLIQQNEGYNFEDVNLRKKKKNDNNKTKLVAKGSAILTLLGCGIFYTYKKCSKNKKQEKFKSVTGSIVKNKFQSTSSELVDNNSTNYSKQCCEDEFKDLVKKFGYTNGFDGLILSLNNFLLSHKFDCEACNIAEFVNQWLINNGYKREYLNAKIQSDAGSVYQKGNLQIEVTIKNQREYYKDVPDKYIVRIAGYENGDQTLRIVNWDFGDIDKHIKIDVMKRCKGFVMEGEIQDFCWPIYEVLKYNEKFSIKSNYKDVNQYLEEVYGCTLCGNEIKRLPQPH